MIFSLNDKQNKPEKTKSILSTDADYSYGADEQSLFVKLCKKFDWNKSLRFLFSSNSPLYARSATPEGYSPWFVSNSNFSVPLDGHWDNYVTANKIEERCTQFMEDFYGDETTRVVFVKKELGGEHSYSYVFWGVFKPVLIKQSVIGGSDIYIKYYDKISDVYPC